jgi:hypothetical protein
MKKDERDTFYNIIKMLYGALGMLPRESLFRLFEEGFLFLPGSMLRKEYEELKEKYQDVFPKKLYEFHEESPKTRAKRQPARDAFRLLIDKMLHEYFFGKMDIFQKQVQLHEILKRDREELDPYDRYFSKGLSILPWEHYEFNVKGSRLDHENLIQSSIMNGIILQGLFFFSRQHVEDLFTVYENKQAPIALRMRAFIGATILYANTIDHEIDEEIQKMPITTHYTGEGEHHLYMFLKAFAQVRHTEEALTNIAKKLAEMATDAKKKQFRISKKKVDNIVKISQEGFKNCLDIQLLGFCALYHKPPVHLYERYDLRFMNNWMLPFSFEHPSVLKYAPSYMRKSPGMYIHFCNENRIGNIDRYINAVSPDAEIHKFINVISEDFYPEEYTDQTEINNFLVDFYRFFKLYRSYPGEEIQKLNPFTNLYFKIRDYYRLLTNVDLIKDLFITLLEINEDAEAISLITSTISAWGKNKEMMELILEKLNKEQLNSCPDCRTEDICRMLLALDPTNKKGGTELIEYCIEVNEIEDKRRKDEYVIRTPKKEQLRILDMLEQNYPEDEDIIELAWDFYLACHKYNKGIKTLHRAVFYYPDDIEYIYNLTELYLLNDQKEEAFKYAKKMVEKEKNDSDAFVRAGHTALVMGDRELALEWYEKGIEIQYKELDEDEELNFVDRTELMDECLRKLYDDLPILKAYGVNRAKMKRIESRLRDILTN